MSRSLKTVCAIAVVLLMTSVASAATIRITVVPSDVPDEQEPRINAGDYPGTYSIDSWQGPATGKSNWHARYLGDGDALSTMFPSDAAGMTIADLAEISYWTKRPTGTPSGRDWWVQIYTRPTVNQCTEPAGGDSDPLTNPGGVGDPPCNAASWYHDRYINNYNEHTNIGDWTEYSTDSGMTFRSSGHGASGVGAGALITLAQLKTLLDSNGDSAAGDLVEMVSIQTDSGWGGFDGYIDGLEVRLNNGNTGQANLESIPADPVPAAGFWMILALVAILGGGISLTAIYRRRTATV